MFGAGELSPFSSDIFEPIDPYSAFARMNRPLRRMERRMEREMGKMLSGIHEDDKSFEVCYCYFVIGRLTWLFMLLCALGCC
jgi:hypothetical protein